MLQYFHDKARDRENRFIFLFLSPVHLTLTRTVYSQERVSKGEFAFNANEAGEYTACFWISDASRESKATVELDWKTGIGAKDWDSVAKREKIEVR